jgi:hypothetical protein
MAGSISLGQIAGLRLSASHSAILGSLSLWGLFAVLGWALFADAGEALVFGLVCTLLHWLSDLVHHLGHARAARQVGYPMIGVRAWFIFGQSLYPADEPPLPGRVHIHRALGGPLASILLGGLAGALALLTHPSSSLAWWALVVLALDNLLLLGFGAFLPLGFTDGSTLLAWRGK